MKCGIYLNPQTPGRAEDGRVIRDVLGQVDYAAARGFNSVWLTEHHFTGYNAYSDPVVLGAAISQRVPELDLGFALGVVPLHHPVRFATQCNLLDQLTGGRLVVGVGPGNCPDEFDGYGLTVADRHLMTEEFLDIAARAWTAPDEGFRYDGRFWQGEVRGRIIPAPVQDPYPQVAWGTGTIATIDKVGARGWSWLISSGSTPSVLRRFLHRYLAALESANHPPAQIERAWGNTAHVLRVFLTEPGEDLGQIDRNVDLFVQRSQVANFGVNHQSPEEVASRRHFYENPFFGGTAEQLIERLRPYAEMGVGTIMCWFNFGDLPDHLVKRSIDRFARDVKPALDAIQPVPDLFDRLRGLTDEEGERLTAPI